MTSNTGIQLRIMNNIKTANFTQHEGYTQLYNMMPGGHLSLGPWTTFTHIVVYYVLFLFLINVYFIFSSYTILKKKTYFIFYNFFFLYV